MTPAKTASAILLGALLLGGVLLTPFLRAQSSAGATKTRDPQDVIKDQEAIDDKIMAIMSTPRLLADPDFRTGDGQKVIPLMRQLISVTRELEASAKSKDIPDLLEQATVDRYNFMAFAAALGDKETTSSLESEAGGKGDSAVAARSALDLARWFDAGKDADTQQKILADITPVARDNPTSPQVLSTMSVMANLGNANNDMVKNIIEAIRTNLKGPEAKELLATLDSVQRAGRDGRQTAHDLRPHQHRRPFFHR